MISALLPIHSGNIGINLVLRNTIFALILFSIGYLTGIISEKKASASEFKKIMTQE